MMLGNKKEVYDKIQEKLEQVLLNPEMKQSFAEDDLQSRSISELRDLAKTLGLAVYGKKQEVIDRILKATKKIEKEDVEIVGVLDLGQGTVQGVKEARKVENEPARPTRV